MRGGQGDHGPCRWASGLGVCRQGPRHCERDTVSITLFPHTLHWALEFTVTMKEILCVRVISFLSLSLLYRKQY